MTGWLGVEVTVNPKKLPVVAVSLMVFDSAEDAVAAAETFGIVIVAVTAMEAAEMERAICATSTPATAARFAL